MNTNNFLPNIQLLKCSLFIIKHLLTTIQYLYSPVFINNNLILLIIEHLVHILLIIQHLVHIYILNIFLK
jgi:hypothetical protein